MSRTRGPLCVIDHFPILIILYLGKAKLCSESKLAKKKKCHAKHLQRQQNQTENHSQERKRVCANYKRSASPTGPTQSHKPKKRKPQQLAAMPSIIRMRVVFFEAYLLQEACTAMLPFPTHTSSVATAYILVLLQPAVWLT